jgi:hypothetical protein
MTGTQNTPRHNVCDHCGRNPHKVAIRRAKGKLPSRVFGYCPSCFANSLARARNLGEVAFEGWSLVYDRRAERTQAQTPMPDYLKRHVSTVTEKEVAAGGAWEPEDENATMSTNAAETDKQHVIALHLEGTDGGRKTMIVTTVDGDRRHASNYRGEASLKAARDNAAFYARGFRMSGHETRIVDSLPGPVMTPEENERAMAAQHEADTGEKPHGARFTVARQHSGTEDGPLWYVLRPDGSRHDDFGWNNREGAELSAADQNKLADLSPDEREAVETMRGYCPAPDDYGVTIVGTYRDGSRGALEARLTRGEAQGDKSPAQLRRELADAYRGETGARLVDIAGDTFGIAADDDPTCGGCGQPLSWHDEDGGACPDDDGPHAASEAAHVRRELDEAEAQLARMRERPFAGACGEADAVSDRADDLRRELALSVRFASASDGSSLTEAQQRTGRELSDHLEAITRTPIDADAVPADNGDVLAIFTPSDTGGAPDPVRYVWASDGSHMVTDFEDDAGYLAALNSIKAGGSRPVTVRESSYVFRIAPGGTYQPVRD